MSIDIETELRLAMEDFTADVQPSPDLFRRVQVRRRSRHLPRLAAVVAATAVAATIAGVVVVSRQTGGSSANPVNPLSTFRVKTENQQAETQAARQMTAAIEGWGPTRGDRATDARLIQRLRNEWAHPTSHPAYQGSFEPVQSPAGPVRILWAGSTPDGVAAVAVQHTNDRVTDYWFGIFLTGADGRPHLAQRAQLIAGVDLAECDPHLLGFTTSPAHHAIVVLPMNADDTVRVSFRAQPSSTGTLVPEWQAAPVHDGAAVVTVPPGGDVWGTVIEVSHNGAVVARHRVDFIGTHLLNEAPTAPSNLLGLWCNGCAVGTSNGPGYSQAMLTAWLVRHGPAYLPVYVGPWSVGARLRDGSNVLATQLWTVGSAARTVVLVDSPDNKVIQVLYDEQTDPAGRPMVAVRLPQAVGWMVGAGPGAVVTGWRTSDTAGWHDVASKKALLVPTDAVSLQLRLVVNGQEQVATR
jgi:hypothetical protein